MEKTFYIICRIRTTVGAEKRARRVLKIAALRTEAYLGM